jgi:hypothetical protein
MVIRANRRWLCLLTALLFAIGSVAHAYAITDAAMNMPSAAMESSDHGMDCGGSDKAAHAACVATCATAFAILSEPVAVPFVVAMQDVVVDPDLPLPSSSPSPEPHPPKR